MLYFGCRDDRGVESFIVKVKIINKLTLLAKRLIVVTDPSLLNCISTMWAPEAPASDQTLLKFLVCQANFPLDSLFTLDPCDSS